MAEIQTIAESCKRIIMCCIDNADTPADEKHFILTAYESGFIGCAEAFAMIATRGLETA